MAHPFYSSTAATVLYDQTTNDSGIGIVSQNFETTFDAYDAAAADDFAVPAGKTWGISEVDIVGVYFNGLGPATSENVYFFADKGGKPGKLVAKYLNVAGTDNGTGSFAIVLPKPLKLKSGHYWMAVQANLAFLAGGEWAWENQTTSEGGKAVWVNPNNGFATGCTTFQTENVCIPDGQGDHMFQIKGQSN